VPRPEKLFLDDVTVGMVFRSSEYRLDADEIKEFAARYDPQPFHVDEDAAKETFFRGLAASGWHVAAITMRLLSESIPFTGGVIGASGEIVWPHPTRPGEILHVESSVLDVTPSRSKPDRGFVAAECRTLNQDGQPRQVLKAKLLVFRRTGGAREGA
jgi:acyl dehydratase